MPIGGNYYVYTMIPCSIILNQKLCMWEFGNECSSSCIHTDSSSDSCFWFSSILHSAIFLSAFCIRLWPGLSYSLFPSTIVFAGTEVAVQSWRWVEVSHGGDSTSSTDLLCSATFLFIIIGFCWSHILLLATQSQPYLFPILFHLQSNLFEGLLVTFTGYIYIWSSKLLFTGYIYIYLII